VSERSRGENDIVEEENKGGHTRQETKVRKWGHKMVTWGEVQLKSDYSEAETACGGRFCPGGGWNQTRAR